MNEAGKTLTDCSITPLNTLNIWDCFINLFFTWFSRRSDSASTSYKLPSSSFNFWASPLNTPFASATCRRVAAVFRSAYIALFLQLAKISNYNLASRSPASTFWRASAPVAASSLFNVSRFWVSSWETDVSRRRSNTISMIVRIITCVCVNSAFKRTQTTTMVVSTTLVSSVQPASRCNNKTEV